MARKKGVGVGWIVFVVVLGVILQFGRGNHSQPSTRPSSNVTYAEPVLVDPEKKLIVVDATQPVVDSIAYAEPLPGGAAVTHTVSATQLRVRDLPTTTAQILGTLVQGTEVVVLGESDGWALVDIGGGRQGWVSGQYLLTISNRQLQKPLNADVAPPLLRPDRPGAGAGIRAAVVGSCDCPYDVKSNGAQCGGSSAWSRPGGKSPVCYVGENTSSTAELPLKAGNKPSCSESGSCYGDISAATGRSKTVYVGGYYRKNGTYVRGYYRSK